MSKFYFKFYQFIPVTEMDTVLTRHHGTTTLLKMFAARFLGAMLYFFKIAISAHNHCEIGNIFAKVFVQIALFG